MDPKVLPMSVAEHEAVQRRRRCQAQLERDQKAVLGMKAALARSDDLCEEFVDKLSTVQEKVVEIEERLRPLEEESAKHTRIERNIPLYIAELERVDALFEWAHEADDRLRYGPDHGPGSIGDYVTKLDEVKAALAYFRETAPDGVDQHKLAEQLKAGIERILKAFLKITESGRRYSVAEMRGLATARDEASSNAGIVVFPEDDDSQDKLSRAATWLDSSAQNPDFVGIYAETRSSALVEAMTSLQDSLRGHRDPHGHKLRDLRSIGLGTPTPDSDGHARGQARSDSPWKWDRHTPGVLTPTPFARTHARGRSVHRREENACSPEVIDSHLLATMFVALCKILRVERAALGAIIPAGKQHGCFQLLASSPVAVLLEEGERFCQCVKRTPKESPRAVVACLKALKQIQLSLPGYQEILRSFPNAPMTSSITDLADMLKDGCHKALLTLAENLKVKSFCFQTLPADGTVHELTCSTVNFVLGCAGMISTVGSLLQQSVAHGDDVAALPVCLHTLRNDRAPPPAEQNAVRFLSDVISGLGRSLSVTTLSYEQAALQLVFRMNNLNFVLKSLRDSPAGLVDPEVAMSLAQFLQLHEQTYLRTVWKTARDYLTVPKGMPADNRLSKRQRAAVKEKLLGFNKELGEIAAMHSSYAMPDLQLRQSVRDRNHQLIVPEYTAFLQRVDQLSFTKKPKTEFIIHRPEAVAAILSTFFDGSS